MKQVFYLLSIIFVLTFFTITHADAQSRKHKRHWSHRKKDAVIGAGAGAVTGAVVSHHHAKGAVVGGAVGAGAGYLVGKKKDKNGSK